MVDPISVISLVEGSIGLVLQCGSVAKTLSDMMAKSKHAEVAITSMIQEVETIQFAWNRIKEWSEEHAEAATDSQFVQRLEKSLQCGTLVLSALEQDLANYKHTADSTGFILRSKMAWNERAFLDHQHRVRGQVQAMTLMLQVSQLSTSKAQTKLLDKKEKALRASDESAYSIVPSRMSSHMSVSIRSRDSVSSIESKELVYNPLSFEDDLFTARVYKRNYRSPRVDTLSKLHQGKRTEERSILGAVLKASENGPLLSSSSSGTTTPTTRSVDSWRSNQRISPRGLRLAPPGLVFTKATELQYELIPLLSAAVLHGNVDNVRTLIDQGAQVNPRNSVDRPPLDLAISNGDVSMTEFLLQNGANLAREWRGTPAIHLACAYGNFKIARLLLDHGASASSLDAQQEQPLHAVLSQRVRFDASDLIGLLRSRGADINARTRADKTPLHLSCEHDNVDNVRALLAHGAGPNSICEGGRTAFHILAEIVAFPNHIIHDAFPAIFGLLHDHGADVNAEDEFGNTPFHVYAENVLLASSVPRPRRGAFFELFLLHGANINAQNGVGNTPFHILIKVWDCLDYPAELEAVARLSIQHGVNVEAQNKAGDTPLHILVRRFRKSETLIQLLLKHGVNVNVQNEVGDTPLHVLVGQPLYRGGGWTEIKAVIQLLLQHGADVNTRNKAGGTPLHSLFDKEPSTWYREPGYEAVIELLLQHGTDVNTRNKAGDTPLHIIVNRGLEEGSTFQFLIDHGAEVGIQNNAGDTPLDRLARSSYSVENNAVVEKIN